ncbi:hypothetical protein [Chondromyces apiculatus]|nr:hypothetical protein [Chondromyces apiculatus]
MRIHGMALLLAAAVTPLACAQGMQLDESTEALQENDGQGEVDEATAVDADTGTDADTEEASTGDKQLQGAATACTPGHGRACYTGLASTRDVGACSGGIEICFSDGSGYGPCEHEVLPAEETCANDIDDDCDGAVNEGCECTPGDTEPCYNGPPGTEGVGICQAGMRTCTEEGTWSPACVGEVQPSLREDLNSPYDDDCTGTPHDSLCEQNGILTCPSGNCMQVPHCSNAGGIVACAFPWECLP